MALYFRCKSRGQEHPAPIHFPDRRSFQRTHPSTNSLSCPRAAWLARYDRRDPDWKAEVIGGAALRALQGAVPGERLELEQARILILDDESAVTALLEQVLHRGGHQQVVSTTDPREALGLFDAFRPDLVLRDIRRTSGCRTSAGSRSWSSGGVGPRERTRFPFWCSPRMRSWRPGRRRSRAARRTSGTSRSTGWRRCCGSTPWWRGACSTRVLTRERNAALEQRIRGQTEEIGRSRLELLERLAATRGRDRAGGGSAPRSGSRVGFFPVTGRA